MDTEATPTGGQTNAGAQGNAANGQQAAQAPATNTAPTELAIKYNGKQVAVPISRAVELAQKGMNYEERMAEVNQRSKHVASFDQFMADRQANPLLDEAVRLAISNPGLVLQSVRTQPGAPSQQPAGSDGEDGQEPVHAQRGNEALVSEIQSLKGTVQALIGKDMDREVQTALDREIARHPWVAGHSNAEKFVRDHVQANIEAARAQNMRPQSVDILVLNAASMVKDVIAEQDQARIRQAEERQQARTAPANRGGPVLTPAPKLSAASLTDGKLLNAALQRGKEMLGW